MEEGKRGEFSTRLWDLSERRTIKQFDRRLRRLFYVPGGKNLVSGADDGTVRIWDPKSGKEEFKACVVRGLGYYYLALSADGKTLAAWSRNSTVRLWSVPSGKELLQLPGHVGGVLALAFTPDGKGLVSRGGDYSYRLWDWRAAKEIRRYPWTIESSGADVRLPGHMLALSPDGTLLAGQSPYPGTIGLWEVNTGKVRAAARGHLAGSFDLAFMPDGDALAYCTDRYAGLWSAQRAKEIDVFDAEPGVENGAKQQFRNFCMAASPDGETLAIFGTDSHLRFWNWRSGALLRQVKIPVRDIGGLAYSPAGTMLASSGRAGFNNHPLSDPMVRLWDGATGKLLRELKGHRGSVVSVAFSPDGRTLASAGEADRTVRLWNVFTGEELARFEGHTGPVYAVAFSPDGRVLASGSGDTTILLWDLRDVKAPPAAPVTDAAALTKLWADLSGEPARAYAATWALAGGGDKAVALLRGHLRPAPPPDAARVRKLLADLASDTFSVREAAAKALAKFGRPVEPALRQRLAEKPSADLRKRLESILSQVRAAPPSQGALRDSRAVQALELIGTAEARALLKQLASGEPTAPLTRNARLALARLERRLK
jgi:WD40 repeat protein